MERRLWAIIYRSFAGYIHIQVSCILLFCTFINKLTDSILSICFHFNLVGVHHRPYIHTKQCYVNLICDTIPVVRYTNLIPEALSLGETFSEIFLKFADVYFAINHATKLCQRKTWMKLEWKYIANFWQIAPFCLFFTSIVHLDVVFLTCHPLKLLM